MSDLKNEPTANKRKSDKLDNRRTVKAVRSDKLPASKGSTDNGESTRRSTKRKGIIIDVDDRLFLMDSVWSVVKRKSSGNVKAKYRLLKEKIKQWKE